MEFGFVVMFVWSSTGAHRHKLPVGHRSRCLTEALVPCRRSLAQGVEGCSRSGNPWYKYTWFLFSLIRKLCCEILAVPAAMFVWPSTGAHRHKLPVGHITSRRLIDVLVTVLLVTCKTLFGQKTCKSIW